jgi:hypothetical protein
MKMQAYITLFIASTIIFCGCSENQLTTTYINDLYGIGIDPPPNWIQKLNNESFIAAWQPTNNSTISFIIYPPYRLDEGLALSIFADDIEETYPEIYSNYTTINRDWTTVRGLTAYEIEYTYKSNNRSNKEKQIAIKHTRDVYILIYQGPQTEYKNFISIINQSITTFQVK